MNDIRAKVLWWAAQRRIKLDKPYIIAVTGSIAKTSTKVAIGAVLRRAYPNQVRVGSGNLNSFLGVPLAILGFDVDFYKQKITWQWLWILKLAIWRGLFSRLPKYLVLEYGADKPGDIAALAKMLSLDGAVITIVSPAHLEFYNSVEDIAKEKAQILSAVKPGGWALVNKNDPFRKLYHRPGIDITTIETKTVEIAITFAIMLGHKLNIKPEIVEAAVMSLPRPEGRLQMKTIISDRGKHINLLDDSYNANPLSMTAALSMLSKIPAPRLVILGDMLELGIQSEDYHRQIGEEARKVADKIIGVGELAKFYQPDRLFSNSEAAIQLVLSVAPDYSSILVKGSHGVKMDKIVTALVNRYSGRNR